MFYVTLISQDEVDVCLLSVCGSVAERSKVSNSGPMVVSSNPALGHQC